MTRISHSRAVKFAVLLIAAAVISGCDRNAGTAAVPEEETSYTEDAAVPASTEAQTTSASTSASAAPVTTTAPESTADSVLPETTTAETAETKPETLPSAEETTIPENTEPPESSETTDVPAVSAAAEPVFPLGDTDSYAAESFQMIKTVAEKRSFSTAYQCTLQADFETADGIKFTRTAYIKLVGEDGRSPEDSLYIIFVDRYDKQTLALFSEIPDAKKLYPGYAVCGTSGQYRITAAVYPVEDCSVSMSKPTAQKRIDELILSGYIYGDHNKNVSDDIEALEKAAEGLTDPMQNFAERHSNTLSDCLFSEVYSGIYGEYLPIGHEPDENGEYQCYIAKVPYAGETRILTMYSVLTYQVPVYDSSGLVDHCREHELYVTYLTDDSDLMAVAMAEGTVNLGGAYLADIQVIGSDHRTKVLAIKVTDTEGTMTEKEIGYIVRGLAQTGIFRTP